MTSDGLARSADCVTDSHVGEAPAVAPHVRPLGGRRISFMAWGLAGIAGIAIWAAILKFA